MAKHTPTPWEAPDQFDGLPPTWTISDLNGNDICSVNDVPDVPDSPINLAADNAALIVRAVNMHDQLVAAVADLLTMAVDRWEGHPVYADENKAWNARLKAARAALALARGE